MSKNSYGQFFKTAQQVRLGDEPKDRVRFSLKAQTSKAPSAPVSTAKAVEAEEQRLRRKFHMNKKKKSRPPFPMKALAGLAVTMVLAGIYVTNPDGVEKLLSKIEVGAFGQAQAADKETGKKPAEKAAEKSHDGAAHAEKAAAGEKDAAKPKAGEEKTASAEDLGHYEKLKQRKDELDAREKELTELEEELQRQKVELDKRISQLEDMRNQIAQTLKDRVEVDQEKVTKLVDLYSNMKPKQAADVIGSINEDLAVEVLAKMKKKSAAEIMNLLSPDKARVLSEKYTGYRRGTASVAEPKG